MIFMCYIWYVEYRSYYVLYQFIWTVLKLKHAFKSKARTITQGLDHRLWYVIFIKKVCNCLFKPDYRRLVQNEIRYLRLIASFADPLIFASSNSHLSSTFGGYRHSTLSWTDYKLFCGWKSFKMLPSSCPIYLNQSKLTDIG